MPACTAAGMRSLKWSPSADCIAASNRGIAAAARTSGTIESADGEQREREAQAPLSPRRMSNAAAAATMRANRDQPHAQLRCADAERQQKT